METLVAIDWAATAETALYILYVAIGLGFVIFFHELGHFLVAKWCAVCVERFSIGFGPILWSFKKGDTEYALSAIPFGGYVKMLGQDDMDPSQLSSEEIAEHPGSYSAKSVSQRMAIISAGVIMNVLTSLLFFAAAFRMGVETSPAVTGSVQTGMPAWKAGLRHGDTITRINGRSVDSFADNMRGVALTQGTVDLEGSHPDGSTFRVTTVPDMSGTRRMIGVAPSLSLTLLQPKDPDTPIIVSGTAAAKADPPFQPGDLIRKVADVPIVSFAQLQEVLAQRRAETVTFEVERSGQATPVPIIVGPNRFRTLGLWMDIERVTAIQQGSPAEAAGLQVGDKIATVDGKDVGTDINPMTLPDVFAELHGRNVRVAVLRETDGGGKKTVEMNLTPINQPGWIERPTTENDPISVPSSGFAYNVTSFVLKVEPGSPAERASIQPGDRIIKMALVLPENAEPDLYAERVMEFEFSEQSRNWAAAFWTIQQTPNRLVKVTLSNRDAPEVVRESLLEPQLADNWYLPTRGIRLEPLAITLEAGDVAGAFGMGLKHARNTMFEIYLTLRNLVGGFLSPKELSGPIGIATIAYKVAQDGFAQLLLFFGFLSINLAVINFLPIPVLDGGHMVFLGWEAVTRKRPSERILVYATYCGMLFILGLMLFVIYLDIFVHPLGAN